MSVAEEPPAPDDKLRLLPWTTPEGKPCYLSTDSDGSRLSLLADDMEAAQLDSGEQVLVGARAVLADAKAEQPLAAARELQAAPASAPAPEVLHDESLRRELLEHSNHLNARFDQLDAKIYEIVGRLQLLAGCLIALFLGMAVWQISIARQIARLKGARQIGESGGLG